METRERLVAAALTVLERDGSETFSTRAVCALAKVTAPTLYHHFGSADGLLSAAIAEALEQFLARKTAAVRSSDPEIALRQGWDDYVRFAAERPRLYAAMLARLLQGADIPAARHAYALLVERIEAIAALGQLALTVPEGAQTVWASANAASLLYVTSALQGMTPISGPHPAVIDGLRDRAISTILKSRVK